MSDSILHIFEAYGIELEYMIVDKITLKVRPISDLVLKKLNNNIDTGDIEFGDAAWSNELVKHVIELKANGPSPDLQSLELSFVNEVKRMNDALDEFGAMLLPTAMHPTFLPEQETVIWDKEYSEVYQTYNRIFDCRGHGWSNLQSVHINLPFANNDEFGKLHGAIRPVLPLLPFLAASSPLCEGKYGPYLDTRLYYYSQNQRRIPTIIGQIIPERAYTQEDYQLMILDPMYRDVAKVDHDGTLQNEWLNSRSAIARFERNAIEIRLIDISESPRVDFAIVEFAIALVQAIASERWQKISKTQSLDESGLKTILFQVLETNGSEKIVDKNFLETFGVTVPLAVKDLVLRLIEDLCTNSPTLKRHRETLEYITLNGNLSQRVKKQLGQSQPSSQKIIECYKSIAQSLADNELFRS